MKITILLITLTFLSCISEFPKDLVNNNGNTIKQRIKAPNGYEWLPEEKKSFGEFLQNSELEKNGAKILDFKGRPIGNQSEHVAVLKYDVGNKDLQQCADALIRMRAEYLFSLKRYDEIGFHFTSGHLFKWNQYKNGYRPIVTGNNSVTFSKKGNADASYANFRKYLDIIYTYAGTISLNKETRKVENDRSIKTGDMLITAGSPGHAVMIVGRAKAKNGNIVYLLAEGYTPAQSIHIISNPFNGKTNPWYKLSIADASTATARYTFAKTNIRTFK